MKLYTRTGDDGSTGLYGADRVLKTSARVEAYGTVDELSSAVGLARAHNAQGSQEGHKPDEGLDADLAYLQDALFDMGADLSTLSGSRYEGHISRLDAGDVATLEGMIDRYSALSPELRHFIHPGGTLAAAALHVARAVARRAERDVLRLMDSEDVNPSVQVYLNRLSDLLFAMARAHNHAAGLGDERSLRKDRR